MKKLPTGKFKTFGEFILAVKKASDSRGKVVDKRLKLNPLYKKKICPECNPQSNWKSGIFYYCPKCTRTWGITK